MNKVLYISTKGAEHDFRFLSKLSNDFEVTYLHYSSNEIIKEIKDLGIRIIEKKPIIRGFPLFSQLRHLKKIYKALKPDIVHTGYVWQVGILASVLDLHPHLSMPYGSDILVEPDKYFPLKLMVKKVMNQCDHINCDAEFVKHKIIKDYNIEEKKFSVFPRGIDLKLFTPLDKAACRKELGLEQGKFIIHFNRNLSSIYGINSLLKGYRLFASNKNDVVLLILSYGPLKNEVIKFIRTNKLSSKANLIDRVPNNQMPLYLCASDIYISTSKSDGSSLSMLEAMAMGLGLIVTDVPAIKEWVTEENGIMVRRNNSLEVSSALEKYYNDRQLIKTHGDVNILIAREKANWDKNYLKLKDIYAELMGKNSFNHSPDK